MDELEYEPLAAALVSYERLAAEQYDAARRAGQLPEGATLEEFKWALAVVGSRCLGVELLLLALLMQPPEPQQLPQPHTARATQPPLAYGYSGSQACDGAGEQHSGSAAAGVVEGSEVHRELGNGWGQSQRRQLVEVEEQHQQANCSTPGGKGAGEAGSDGGIDESGFGAGAAEGLLRLLLLTAAVQEGGEAPTRQAAAAAGDAHGSGQQPAAASGSSAGGGSSGQQAKADASGGSCGSETGCLEQGTGAGKGGGAGGGSAGGVGEWQVRVLVPMLDFMNHGSLGETGNSSSNNQRGGRNSHSWPLPAGSGGCQYFGPTRCACPGAYTKVALSA